MKATRIKWDEAMLVRCLARVADYSRPAGKKAPVKAEKVIEKIEEKPYEVKLELPSMFDKDNSSKASSVKEEKEFNLDLDIPVESLTFGKGQAKEAPKVEEQVKLKLEPEDGYTFSWDKPIAAGKTKHEAADSWDDFLKAIDRAL